MGEAREEPWDHALGDFELYPTYAVEGPAFGGIPQPNVVGAPQHHPLQPLHFSIGRLPPTMEERDKFDLIEERLKVIEGIGDYPLADMAELCLVPNVIIPTNIPRINQITQPTSETLPIRHLCPIKIAHSTTKASPTKFVSHTVSTHQKLQSQHKHKPEEEFPGKKALGVHSDTNALC